MRPLSTAELLDVWEQSRERTPVERALALLVQACPDRDPASLAALPVGRRDAALIDLREWSFGSEFACLAACPECRQDFELAFHAGDVRLPDPVAPVQFPFRLPDSFDLAALGDARDVAEARRILAERCLPDATDQGEAIRQLAEADPQADIEIVASCPACGFQWQAQFDIASLFWTEIEAWAPRVFGEVHVLASAYGWSERDILALSPWRRQHYLELVGA